MSFKKNIIGFSEDKWGIETVYMDEYTCVEYWRYAAHKGLL